MSRLFRISFLLVVLGVLAACRDESPVPTQPEPRVHPVGTGDPTVVAAYACTVTPAAARVSCERARTKLTFGDVALDAQHAYAALTPANVRYDTAVGRLSLDVTITSAMPQPMGTRDGSSIAAEGVRVVVADGPRVTDGKGTVTLHATGTAPFEAGEAPYFQWSEVLAPGATSRPLAWSADVGAGVKAFAFTAYVVAPVPRPAGWLNVSAAAAEIAPGSVALLQVDARNAVGAPVDAGSIEWQSSDAGRATVAGGIVQALAPGRVTLTAAAGPRTGSTMVDVCHALDVGQALTVSGDDAAGFCVAGADRDYELVATNTAAMGPIQVDVTAGGLAAAAAAFRVPAHVRAPAPFDAAGEGIEWRMRERERRELGPLLAASHYAPGPRPVRSLSAVPPSEGAVVMLNGNLGSSCSSPLSRTGQVKAVGQHVVVVADEANPAGGFTEADYRSLAAQFDTLVWPTVVPVFGAPSDIDGNGRVIVFYTPSVNALTPAGSASILLGAFATRDLFPMTPQGGVAACASSNASEVLYMMAPDPAGTVNQNPRAADWVMRYTLAVQAHELQHLINAANRLYVSHSPLFEETWLNEGLSHVAEELLFLRAAGLSRSDDLSGDALAGAPARVKSAFNRHQAQNFFRYAAFLRQAEGTGPTGQSDDLATRGAAWGFLRWAADRRGGDQAAFWHALTNTTATGRDNLAAALGIGDVSPWLADWAVSVFADDHVPGLAARFDEPSWNARSILPFVSDDPWPLAQHALGSDPVRLTLGASGSAYVSATAAKPIASFGVRWGASSPPPSLVVQVIRTR